ncbi:MAG: AarF/ABC1/UbiB kinase family protein, partial [Chloroflexi bacterium]|nr:AarF/ABC1/UbiB kinase family protein [Chloroflexota bacterium]
HIDGIKISDVAALRAAGVDPPRVAATLIDLYNTMILRYGVFHADPHPGNLFVRPGPKLVIVDFGLAKQLPPGFVQGFARVAAALVAADGPALARAFRDIGFRTRHADDTVFEALAEAMVARLSRNSEFNRDRQLLFDFQDRMMRIFRENPVVRVPGDFLYIGRVMGLLGGLGARLGSDVNLLEVLGAQLPASPTPQLPA